jgi:alpha-ketoglutarate-dependent taurine dioxygenase
MTNSTEMKRLWSTPDMLSIEWADGTLSEYASLWLRDNLPEYREPFSGQRLIDIVDLPEAPKIRSATLDNGAASVEWEAEPSAASFDLAWLLAHAANAPRRQPPLSRRLWREGASLNAARDFAWAAFSEFRGDRSLRTHWLGRLLQDGIAFLSEVPSNDFGILEAAHFAGRVLETNYGLVFDVRSVAQPENLAYSDLGLGLHTDNPYREPVPGFQMLHAVLASPDGGESLFGDGFAIAEDLRAASPDVFAALTTTPVPFFYRSKDAELYAERPLIQLSCDGDVSAVHYNSRSIAPLRLRARDAPSFYRAYRRFAALLRDPRYHLKFRLRDGDLVLFDNRRILHGRTPFSSARYPRHLRGCYLTRDSVYSEAAMMRREFPAEGMQ